MADTATTCKDHSEMDGWLPPPDPSLALNYHYGMLLGVTDFQCEQAYFRGKSRLHNAWLHGHGVVWGYDVQYDDKLDEVRITPGLALDGTGRELLLDADVCASPSEWVNDYIDAKTQPPLDPKGFDLQVVARASTCLARPVPAISIPCADNSKSTAFSRVAERVEIFFRLVPKDDDEDAGTLPDHRIRLFLGIDPPATKNGAIVPEDQAILDLQWSTAGDSQARLATFRELAALDTRDLHPRKAADGDPFSLFPEAESTVVLLAVIRSVKLKKDGDKSKAIIAKADVDITVRPTLLSSGAIQELVLGGATFTSLGPRVVKTELVTKNNTVSISLTLDKNVLQSTLTNDSVLISVIEGNGAGGWKSQQSAATFDAAKKLLVASVPNPPAVGGLIRLIVRGTGPKPVLGTDLVPFAGPGATSPTAHDGADFVYTVRRK